MSEPEENTALGTGSPSKPSLNIADIIPPAPKVPPSGPPCRGLSIDTIVEEEEPTNPSMPVRDAEGMRDAQLGSYTVSTVGNFESPHVLTGCLQGA